MSKLSNKLVVGKIVGHHGIKGELKVHPYSDYPERFLSFPHIFVEGQQEPIEIEHARLHKTNVLLMLAPYHSIESSLFLLNKDVLIERDRIDVLEEGYFVVDLIGCMIVDRDGQSLGILEDVVPNNAHDIYKVKKANGETFYIPVVDEFVKSIDIDQKTIVVELIDGMMESQ